MLCRSFHLKCRVGRQRAIKLKHIFKSICKLTRHPFFILTKDATNLLFSLECRGVPTPKARAPFMVLNSWFSKTKILGEKLRGGAKTLGWISRPNHFIWKLSNIYFKKFHHLNFWHLVGLSNLMIGLHLYFHEHVHFWVINVSIKISYSVKELYSPGITNLTLLNPVLLAFLLRIPP